MPQMMPINWMFSLLFFICIFIMFNIMNYYISPISMNFKLNTSNNSKNKNLIWKW